MNKTRFLEFVHDYILKMFTGSDIIGEEESSTRDNIVASADGGAVKVKFSINEYTSTTLKSDKSAMFLSPTVTDNASFFKRLPSQVLQGKVYIYFSISLLV